MNIEKERELFNKWHYERYLQENPNIDINNARYIYDYAHNNPLVSELRESHFAVWLASANRDGYKLVPVEPAQEMLDKFPEVLYQDTYAGECSMWVDDETVRLGYKAMIGAVE